MTKTFAAIVLTTLVSAFVLWTQAPASAQGQGVITVQFVGTWYSEFTTNGGVSGKALTKYGRNGGVITLDTTDFGGGGTTAGLDSTQMGTWEKTGPQSFTSKSMYFSYDLAGNHLFTVVITNSFDFVHVISPGDSGDFSYVVDLYLASQNPVTDLPFLPDIDGGAGQTWLMTID